MKSLKKDTPVVVTGYDKARAPRLVLSFEKHWVDNLSNISSPELRQNWENNFNAFDEVIDRNRNSKPSKKICCPSPTGSGKTQQAIHKAISLYGSDVGTLIVTMRTEDADLIADQIASGTHNDYVGVHHSKNVSKKGVRNVEDPEDTQCLIITHEMFRRQQDTITEGRDLIIIDEAIDVITHYQIDQDDLEQMLKIIERKRNLNYKNKNEVFLLSEEKMLKTILNTIFKAMKEKGKSFKGSRPGEVPLEDAPLKTLKFKELKKLLEDPSVKPSYILTKQYNDNTDNAIKKKLTDICDNINIFFKQFTFMTKNGYQIAWNTAKELIPNKSLIVMDATASVNKSYELYTKYQPEKLEILPSIECRNYQNVTLYTANTHTGRSTLLAKDKSEGNKLRNKNSRVLVNIIERSTEPDDDILVVTFKNLKPVIEMYTDPIDDRKIRVDHWGNLTGTNKYKDCNKIFIYGLNHKPKEIHRSMHALIKSPLESFKESNKNSMEFNELVRSDIVSEVIQAINRIRCRNVIDDKGNCDTADVYLTLPIHPNSAQEMMIAIKSEMHNIKTAEWEDFKEDLKTRERGSFLESFIGMLDVMLNDKKLEVELSDVLNALQISTEQWRKNIRGNKYFENSLDNSDFLMEMRYKKKLRAKKPNTPWFIRKSS